MKIAKAGYLGYVLKMRTNENGTTKIRRNQGPGVTIVYNNTWFSFIFKIVKSSCEFTRDFKLFYALCCSFHFLVCNWVAIFSLARLWHERTIINESCYNNWQTHWLKFVSNYMIIIIITYSLLKFTFFSVSCYFCERFLLWKL